jgi:ACS family D-galactonate transporter-like MFS transporter
MTNTPASACASSKVAARARWGIALLVLSVCINYIDRGNLSVAAPVLAPELSLNASKLGLLFSAFFATYSVFQIVSGWLVDRYNVNWVYAAGFFVWSLATLLTGFCSAFAMLLLFRFILGVGESVAYPAISKIIATNFAERHRGLLNAFVDAGAKAGPAIGTLVGGLLIVRYGWRAWFIGLGAGSLLWLIPWVIYARETPAMAKSTLPSALGFHDILRRRAAWGTLLGMFCYGYVWYFVLSWLPSYLVTERHFSLSGMAWIASLSYWVMALSAISFGWISDRLIRSGAAAIRTRKRFIIAGLLGCIVLLPAALAPNVRTAVVLLLFACAAIGLFSSNCWALTQTLAGPEASGRWTGIQNAVGNLGGVLSPFVTGYLVNRNGTFLLPFAIASLMLLLGAASYFFLVREEGHRQLNALTPGIC